MSEPRFTADFLYQALAKFDLPKSLRESAKGFDRIWTDTRTCRAEDLFAAIPGEKFDGHDYVLEASRKGASGALVSRKDFKGADELPENFALIEVADTTEALRQIAAAHRRRLQIPVVAIAGSNGKTTTKEWLAHLLKALKGSKAVYKTERSLNSILGIALSLLQIRDEEIAVIEVGIDEIGWMEKHLEVVRPTHGPITTIGEEHLNRLGTLEKVAQEELKLLSYLKAQNGGFAANQDCPWVSKETYPENSLRYGLEASAEIEGRYGAPNLLHAFGVAFKSPLPGRHNAQNLLAALAMVRLLDPEISLETLHSLANATVSFEGEAHRSKWLELKSGVRVYDDCYNANPSSMQAALKTFLELSDGCRQHFVVGDMLDLGDSSAEAHRRVLNLAIVMGADHIYLLGSEFKAAYEASIDQRPTIQAFSDIPSLQTALKQQVREGDCVFLKGSRGMKLERVLEGL